MSVSIRDATPEDAPGIALVHVEGWQTTYRGLLPDSYLDGLDVKQRTDSWHRGLAAQSPGRYVVVAEDGREVVGFGSAGPAGNEALEGYDCGVSALYVRPAHRSRKTGERLLAGLFERLRKDGRRTVSLWVLDGNDRAEAFYRRQGAHEIKREDRPGAGGTIPEIAMGWTEPAMTALIERAAA